MAVFKTRRHEGNHAAGISLRAGMWDDRTDDELIANIAAGESAAFETLYHRHAAHVYQAVLRVGQDAALAEDLVQEVFWRVWRRSAGFAGDHDQVAAWLRAVAPLRAVFPQPPAQATPQAWMAWAAQVTHTPQVTLAGPFYDGFQTMTASELSLSLYCAARDGALGMSLGRDVVMRLGDDGVTPDLLFITPERYQHLHSMYLDGSADLVIEITMLGHERDETEIRRRIYAAAGIPEYWIVDPTAQRIHFLRWVDGAYQEQPLAQDGRYRPAHLPGLTCVPARLWDRRQGSGDCHVFEGAAPAVPTTLPRLGQVAHADEWVPYHSPQ